MMLGDASAGDAIRRSGVLRSTIAHSSMRGLGATPCCSSCAGAEGLGDLSSVAQVITQSKWLDALFVLSLTVGAVAGGMSIYDHLTKKRRRRYIRHTSPTMTIPVQSMRDLVYGDEEAA